MPSVALRRPSRHVYVRLTPGSTDDDYKSSELLVDVFPNRERTTRRKKSLLFFGLIFNISEHSLIGRRKRVTMGFDYHQYKVFTRCFFKFIIVFR